MGTIKTHKTRWQQAAAAAQTVLMQIISIVAAGRRQQLNLKQHNKIPPVWTWPREIFYHHHHHRSKNSLELAPSTVCSAVVVRNQSGSSKLEQVIKQKVQWQQQLPKW